MFTGIIQAQADINEIRERNQGRQLEIALPGGWQPRIGASIAIDGICLTVESFSAPVATFYVSQETMAATTAADWATGRRMHLESALKIGDSLDGHTVQGHIDAVGELVSREEIGEDVVLGYRFPADLQPLIFNKGSVAVDGVSLTVNNVDADIFFVNIIPHTQSETHLSAVAVGCCVNLETDPIARQVYSVVRQMQLADAGKDKAY